ncbi:MAG: hypothetical protein R3B07_34430 [Polyangiaceae bacterium]
MTSERAKEVVNAILKREDSDKQAAWARAHELWEARQASPWAAEGLAFLIKAGAFERDTALRAAAGLLTDYREDPAVMGRLGQAFESLCDIRYLNAAPPDDPVLLQIAESLRQLASRDWELEDEIKLLHGLDTAARLLGRGWDEIAERCALRLVELKPDDWTAHFDLGLFYKTRGRFAEGVAANLAASKHGGASEDPVIWNLGICATGAGDAECALRVWKSIDQNIELGLFGLPEGGYHSVKVRLAELPLAERNADCDDPGLEETVWIERLSPCHGIIRSALFQDLGVDFGDVVLFDGAPITFQEYGGQRVAVFPHLATLVRPGYRILRFGGTQAEPKQIAELSHQLPADTTLYAHTEQFIMLCRACWEGGKDHKHDADRPEHRVVSGKLCIPPNIDPADLMEAIDRAVVESGAVQLFIPELCALVGDTERAEVEGRRLAMIQENK